MQPINVRRVANEPKKMSQFLDKIGKDIQSKPSDPIMEPGWYYLAGSDSFALVAPHNNSRNQRALLIKRTGKHHHIKVIRISEDMRLLTDKELPAVDNVVTDMLVKNVARLVNRWSIVLDVDKTVLTGEVLLRINRRLRDNAVSFFADSMIDEDDQIEEDE